MPTYVPTDWVDNVTPVNAANMDKMEAGIAAAVAGALPADTVVVAATRILANKLLVGDTQPVCRLMGDGKIEWGQGGSTVPDTNLYRSSLNTLKTDDSLIVAGDLYANSSGKIQYLRSIEILPQAVATVVFESAAPADIGWRFFLKADGKMAWGSGTDFTGDVNLYRYSASVLRTDTGFSAGGNIEGNAHVIVGDHLYWAAGPYDTSLYRAGAGILKTDSNLRVGGYLDVQNADFGQLRFGSALDTNLYRAGAGVLRTDGQLAVKGNPAGTEAIGIIVGQVDGLPLHVQGAAGSGYGGIIGHNVWLRASDGAYVWDTSHGSFGSRAISMSYEFGISFYADAAASTAGSIANAPLRLRIGNDGQTTIYGPTQIQPGATKAVEIGVDRLGGGQASINFGSAFDTNLYRSAAGTLKTDGTMAIGGQFYVGHSGGNGAIFFGLAQDTVLYSPAADTLKTDDGIYTLGGLVTKAKAGIPTDTDLVVGMQKSGAMIVDTTNSRLYVRVGTVWKYAALV